MKRISGFLIVGVFVPTLIAIHASSAATIKVGVAQTVIETTLAENRDKILKFVSQAKSEDCQIIIFPEAALYWSDIAAEKPTTAELDAAIAQIGKSADSQDIYVVLGVGYRKTNSGQYVNWAIVFDPDGHRVLSYKKNYDVPQRFYVNDVPFNVSICSDRGYLEDSDLPCLVQNSQVIIDTSGGHGGDDGRPDLRWIRYRPWATRTGAYVIVCNPVHADTDFMGHRPWGGGSAIVRPDGSIQASRTYEPDVLIVGDIDTSKVTRTLAERRRDNPIFKPFWDMGKKLLEGGKAGSVPDVKPYQSAQRNVTIAAAQIACSTKISDNVRKITDYIHKAAESKADIVVFPELAITGSWDQAVRAAGQADLDTAINRIRKEADLANIYVIVGTPYFVDGRRRNCAFVIGDDGTVKTCYCQIAASGDLFKPGLSAKAMWFELKGVQSIVTIGHDADWIEIPDLAADRGMYLHFHITSETYPSADATILGKQRNLLMLMYARFGAVVNAASDRDTSGSGGISMIVSREGGHNKPAPAGIEYYLPYQTSVVRSTGSAETMIVATRRTRSTNDMNLTAYWRNRNRKSRPGSVWYDWIKKGALLIGQDGN